MANTYKTISFVKFEFYQFMLFSTDYGYFGHSTICLFKEVDSEMREARTCQRFCPHSYEAVSRKKWQKGNCVFGICILSKPHFSCLAPSEGSQLLRHIFPFINPCCLLPGTDLSLIRLGIVLFHHFPNGSSFMSLLKIRVKLAFLQS